MQNLLFYLCVSVFTAHELDAVAQAEWRLLYVLRDLPEDTAAAAFIGLHVPLFAVLLWLCCHRRETIRARSRVLFAVFMVVHSALHVRLQGNPLSPFDSPLSLVLIHSGALLGLLYIVAVYQAKKALRNAARC